LKTTKTEASARLLPMHPVLKQALPRMGSQAHYSRAEDFVFPSHRFKGLKPVDLAAVLKRKIKPAFVTRVGWHTFRHTVGTCWPRWANTSSRFATTCDTATCM
jgi:integrase